MTSTKSRQNRTTLQNNIRSKQSLYARFNRRLSASNSHAERSFIRNEMNRICKELNQCARQWKNCGFGSNNWVTRNCTPKSATSFGTNNRMNSRSSNRSNKTTTKRTTRTTTTKRTKRTTNRKTTNPWMYSFSR